MQMVQNDRPSNVSSVNLQIFYNAMRWDTQSSVNQEHLAPAGHNIDILPITALGAPFGEEDGSFHDKTQGRRVHHQQDGIDHSSDLAYLTLPASYLSSRQELSRIDSALPESLMSCFAHEVDVSELNKMNKHLWLAGLERPTRALHHQIALGREIIVIEKADVHMLWEGPRIYIKPLPDFILCHKIWKDYICTDRELFEEACGFLLSYI